MAKQLGRQIRFNFELLPIEQKTDWWFLIINQQREIDRILQRIYKQLPPIEDSFIESIGVVKGESTRYQLISFSSYSSKTDVELNWDKIYQGTRSRDENLFRRQATDGLAQFVDKKVAKKEF